VFLLVRFQIERRLIGVNFPTYLMRFRDFSEFLLIRFTASERSVYELSFFLVLVDGSDSVAFCQ